MTEGGVRVVEGMYEGIKESFGGIRNVGEILHQHLIEERKRNQPDVHLRQGWGQLRN